MLVVTTDDLPGYEIRQVLGQVMGSTGRLRNAFMEGVRTLERGDKNPRMPQHLISWRSEAIEHMVTQARERGANAVIAMRFDNREITEVWSEICAYGTAVYVVPLHQAPHSTAAVPARETDGERVSGRAHPLRGRQATA
jgi:uncharacterized protein YbjQ (UPF0145 family)